MTAGLQEHHFSRKTFLKGGGALVVAFGLPLSLAGTAAAEAYPNIDASQLDSWLAIGQDGTVSVFTGRNDSGQHKQSAFAQIVGDELDVAFDSITIVMGDTAKTANQGSSTASDGMLNGAKPVRHAAAEARRVLLGLAAARLGVPAAQLSVTDGVISVAGNPSQKVTYGELIGDRRFATTVKVLGSGGTLDIQGQARIKDPSQYKLIGKSIPSVTIPAKVSGSWTYVQNIRLPGMLHARVVMPPSVGAHLASFDGFKSKPEGIVKVVANGDFLAVVTRDEWQGIQAINQIKATWKETPSLSGSGDLFHWLRTAPVQARANIVPPVGNVDAALAGAAKTLTAQYNYPVNNHGMIGPSCAVADVRGDQCVVWSGTQAPFATRTAVADMIGVPETNVRVISVAGSGAYGRMGTDDAAPAAAYLSQQVGKPVRLQWMRQQEHGWQPPQPPAAFDLRAGVDASGKVVAFDQQLWTWGYSGDVLPTMLMARGAPTAGAPFLHGPSGGDVGTYTFDNMRLVSLTVPPMLRGTYMRSPGRIAENFAHEQFLDEIASATGQDPIAFRLRHLANNNDPYTLVSIKPRITTVLQTVQKVAGWQNRPSPGPDAGSSKRVVTGRGIAIVASQRSSYIANVAEVEVDRKTGKVHVVRMHVVVDAGQIVNPDGLRSQIEGATVYAASRALMEQMVFDRSKILSNDWVGYPILRFKDLPQEVNVTLIDQPTLSPAGSFDNGGMGSYVNSGIGEPPNTVVPAAIANAFFDATGVRMRQPPLTPVRVRATLRAAGLK